MSPRQLSHRTVTSLIFRVFVFCVAAFVLCCSDGDTVAQTTVRNGLIRVDSHHPNENSFLRFGVDLMNPDGSARTMFRQFQYQGNWSPDGARLLYGKSIDLDNKILGIYVEDYNGANVRKVTDNSAGGSIGSFDWLPDGRIIYIRQRSSGAPFEIREINVDGTNDIQRGVAPYSGGIWSPDGKQAITRNGSDFYLMNGDGSNIRRLTLNVVPKKIDWSPDGTKIVYDDGGCGQCNQNVYIANADGSAPRLVAHGKNPTWSPDGTKIIIERGSDHYDGVAIFDANTTDPYTVERSFNGSTFPTWQPRRDDAPLRPLLQLSEYDYAAYEGRAVTLTVTRLGDLSGEASVEYFTSDGIEPGDFTPRTTTTAWAGYDYMATSGVLRFAPGQASATFTVPVMSDYFVEYGEVFSVNLRNVAGDAVLNRHNVTVPVYIYNGYPTQVDGNLIDRSDFFIHQHYQDFLQRDPEREGFFSWVGVFERCAGDRTCLENARINVSASFFRSEEFKQKGYYTYRFYKAAFGRRPTYRDYSTDMIRSYYNRTAEQVRIARDAFPAEFAAREEFKAKYDGLSNADYVALLLRTAGVEVNRGAFINDLNANRTTRAEVLRAVVESPALAAKDYNEAFVTMQYFGYLRRDPEQNGFDAWLRVLERNPSDYQTMVKGFVNSIEYRSRFGRP